MPGLARPLGVAQQSSGSAGTRLPLLKALSPDGRIEGTPLPHPGKENMPAGSRSEHGHGSVRRFASEVPEGYRSRSAQRAVDGAVLFVENQPAEFANGVSVNYSTVQRGDGSFSMSRLSSAERPQRRSSGTGNIVDASSTAPHPAGMGADAQGARRGRGAPASAAQGKQVRFSILSRSRSPSPSGFAVPPGAPDWAEKLYYGDDPPGAREAEEEEGGAAEHGAEEQEQDEESSGDEDEAIAGRDDPAEPDATWHTWPARRDAQPWQQSVAVGEGAARQAGRREAPAAEAHAAAAAAAADARFFFKDGTTIAPRQCPSPRTDAPAPAAPASDPSEERRRPRGGGADEAGSTPGKEALRAALQGTRVKLGEAEAKLGEVEAALRAGAAREALGARQLLALREELEAHKADASMWRRRCVEGEDSAALQAHAAGTAALQEAARWRGEAEAARSVLAAMEGDLRRAAVRGGNTEAALEAARAAACRREAELQRALAAARADAERAQAAGAQACDALRDAAEQYARLRERHRAAIAAQHAAEAAAQRAAQQAGLAAQAATAGAAHAAGAGGAETDLLRLALGAALAALDAREAEARALRAGARRATPTPPREPSAWSPRRSPRACAWALREPAAPPPPAPAVSLESTLASPPACAGAGGAATPGQAGDRSAVLRPGRGWDESSLFELSASMAGSAVRRSASPPDGRSPGGAGAEADAAEIARECAALAQALRDAGVGEVRGSKERRAPRPKANDLRPKANDLLSQAPTPPAGGAAAPAGRLSSPPGARHGVVLDRGAGGAMRLVTRC
jgi:hypothetical protein